MRRDFADTRALDARSAHLLHGVYATRRLDGAERAARERRDASTAQRAHREDRPPRVARAVGDVAVAQQRAPLGVRDEALRRRRVRAVAERNVRAIVERADALNVGRVALELGLQNAVRLVDGKSTKTLNDADSPQSTATWRARSSQRRRRAA